MSVLDSIYGVGVKARNVLYDRRILPVHALVGPVVSVGNLSVGGSGKTPFVIMLGELLKQRGVAFDVLSRGYGRQTRGVLQVDPAGTAQQFGDEPLLMARRLQVPVIVGESRYKAGILAEKEFGPQLHLLDDGFQHRSLAREFDIVLVAAEDVCDRLLPGGRLREPAASLSRADVVVLGSGASLDGPPLQGKLVWRTRRGIAPGRVSQRPIAFCGIARPQNFFAQLRAAGIELAAEVGYRDHHPYTGEDIERLLELRKQNQADGFVTTEKDAVNLVGLANRLDPLAVVAVKMELEDGANALDIMLRTIQERKRERIQLTS
jgi:tetraacyldisaccharide 4'-kinase